MINRPALWSPAQSPTGVPLVTEAWAYAIPEGWGMVGGNNPPRGEGHRMKKAIAQETLKALVERGGAGASGAADRGGLAAGNAPRGQMAADSLAARTGQRSGAHSLPSGGFAKGWGIKVLMVEF